MFRIFFAPGQLEVLLDNAVSFKEAINLKHIQNINNDYYQPAKVTYIKCPVCRILMNRINFGVIVVWLPINVENMAFGWIAGKLPI